MQNLGLYIHIPFCSRICIYCDFFVSTSRKRADELVRAINTEAEILSQRYHDNSVGTLYFGGGTPSILSSNLFASLTDNIRNNFKTTNLTEFTIEANPVDLNEEKLHNLLRIGVNRLSIGIQSFNDKELIFLSRNHSSQIAIDSIVRAKKAGFSNFNIDLIYGIPGQTLKNWGDNLDRAISLEPQHLSLYNLTIEPKTHLFKMVQRGKISPADEGLELDMFLMAVDFLKSNGYNHYEISNFSKLGFESKHNSNYWNGHNYLGLGPSAHSFFGEVRWWNASNLDLYCESLNKNTLPIEESEELDRSRKTIEYFLLNFRQKKGINVSVFQALFGVLFFDAFSEVISKYEKYLDVDENTIRLNSHGFFIYNKICQDFVDKI